MQPQDAGQCRAGPTRKRCIPRKRRIWARWRHRVGSFGAPPQTPVGGWPQRKTGRKSGRSGRVFLFAAGTVYFAAARDPIAPQAIVSGWKKYQISRVIIGRGGSSSADLHIKLYTVPDMIS